MDEFYTVNQAAIVLKVHALTIRRYIKEGRLKAYKAGGNIRIAINDLKNFTQNIDPQPSQKKNNRMFQNNSSSFLTKPFSLNDPLFRIKAKGRSMTKLEE